MHASSFSPTAADRPLHVGLVGLGQSTLAAHSYLRAQHAVFSVRDRRHTLPDGLVPSGCARVLLGDSYLDGIDEDVLVLSPSVRPDHPRLTEAAARGVRLTTECELFYSLYAGTLYAVSGSDGKSTTVSIAHRLLQAGGHFSNTLLGGNIGTPLLSLPYRDQMDTVCVAELSSFQLMHAVPCADRALLTNLTPNHLDLHTSPEEYYNVKIDLLKSAKEVVLNADDDKICALLQRDDLYAVYTSGTRPVPRAEHVYRLEKGAVVRDGELLLSAEAMADRPPLFQKNLLAALALCEGKIDRQTLCETVNALRPLSHRAETVCMRDGIRYVDSSADTTPSRTAATLSQTEGPIVLLAGGHGKRVAYDPILPHLSSVRRAVLYGENREEIAEVLRHARCPYTLTDTLSAAVTIARETAEPGDTVLLSPMSTSHDQYADYRARAADFRAAIAALR